MANIVEWQLRLNAAPFVAPAAVAVHKIVDIGASARTTVPAVVALGDRMAETSAGASKLAGEASAAAKRMDELRAAARKASVPTDQERMINAAMPSGLIAQEGAMKRQLALMDKLRAASRKSAEATDAEKMIGGAVPSHLKAAPQMSVGQRVARRMLQDVNQITGGRALGAVSALSARFDRLSPAIDIAGAAGRRMLPVLSAIGSGALLAAKGVGVLAAGAVVASVGFAGAVVKAQATREGIMKGLEVQLKSRALAESTMVQATRTADMIGESRMAVAGQFNDLLAKGFSVPRVDEIVKRMADLKVVDPSADQAGITRAIGQIAGTGRLQGDELNQLAENGLETGAVYDAIGKKINKTRAEVIKLKEAGKIDSDTAIQGILDAVANQTGNKAPGALAADVARNSLDGILRRFSNLPGNLLSSIGVDKELGTLKNGMNEFLTYFETTGGAKAADALESTFGALVNGFFGVDIAEEGGITKGIDKVLDLVKNSGPEIESFAADVRQGFELFGNALEAVDKIDGIVDDVSKLTGALGAVRDVVGFAFDPIKSFFYGTLDPSQIMGSINQISDALDGITLPSVTAWAAGLQADIVGVASSAFTWATDIGVQIVAGIEAGITGAYGRVVGAVSGMANGAIDTAVSVLRIGSPSKAFHEIGAFTMMGFERGVAANSNGLLDPFMSAVDIEAPDLAAITSGAASVAGLAGGGGITVGDIIIDARGAQEPQRVAELVREEVIRTLEIAGMSVGAAA